MSRLPFEFTHAVVRRPSPSVVDGISSRDLAPEFDEVLAEHDAYVAALTAAGLDVVVLAPLAAFPDSIFVEDAAFVLPEGAILLRPGAPSRRGEQRAIAPAIERHFGTVSSIASGAIDGGDILALPDEILVGLSDRTDREGAEAFADWARGIERSVRIVQTPTGALHLKSGCSLVDARLILATPAIAASGMFPRYEVMVTADGESNAANAIRVNDHLLVSASGEGTATALEQRGLNVVRLQTGEIEKLDAGLSCMSLRW